MEKSKVMNVLSQMPETFNLEDLIEKLIFIAKIEEGLNDIEEGNVVDHNAVINKCQSGRKWSVENRSYQ